MGRRDELLDGLVGLFLDEGFLALGVGDLADRLRCSRTTLYRLADSKEQLIVLVVRAFFRRSAERVEAAVADRRAPDDRVRTYLKAVAAELAPASRQFYADLLQFPPAAEVYRSNTRYAAARVHSLLAEGVEAGVFRAVDSSFVGAAVAHVMAAIGSGAMAVETHLDDAASYRALADLLLHGVAL